jgi:hypothetical protein
MARRVKKNATELRVINTYNNENRKMLRYAFATTTTTTEKAKRLTLKKKKIHD